MFIALYFKRWHMECLFQWTTNHIGGVRVSVFLSSAEDRRFERRSGQIKDNKNSICCFSNKHSALRSKNKHELDGSKNNVSEWSDMSMKIQLSVVSLLRGSSYIVKATVLLHKKSLAAPSNEQWPLMVVGKIVRICAFYIWYIISNLLSSWIYTWNSTHLTITNSRSAHN